MIGEDYEQEDGLACSWVTVEHKGREYGLGFNAAKGLLWVSVVYMARLGNRCKRRPVTKTIFNHRKTRSMSNLVQDLRIIATSPAVWAKRTK